MNLALPCFDVTPTKEADGNCCSIEIGGCRGWMFALISTQRLKDAMRLIRYR